MTAQHSDSKKQNKKMYLQCKKNWVSQWSWTSESNTNGGYHSYEFHLQTSKHVIVSCYLQFVLRYPKSPFAIMKRLFILV